MWLWKKINIRKNHRIYLANSSREAFNHLRWCCWKNSAAHIFGEKQKENMRSAARLEQAYTVLKLSMNHRWGQQRNCLSSSRSLGKCSSARFSSRLPLFPVPPTPGWGWEPPAEPGFAELAPWPRQGCSLPLRAAAGSSATTAKAHFCNFCNSTAQHDPEQGKHLKTHPSPRRTSGNNLIASFLRYFPACTRR